MNRGSYDPSIRDPYDDRDRRPVIESNDTRGSAPGGNLNFDAAQIAEIVAEHRRRGWLKAVR